jgi:hypothetical protein
MINLSDVSNEIKSKMYYAYCDRFGEVGTICFSARKKDDFVTVHSHLGSMVFDKDGQEV